MLIRLISGLFLLSLSAFAVGLIDPAAQTPAPAKPGDLKPFTVAVVDKKTRKPVTEFYYDAIYRVPGPNTAWKSEWHRIESPSGSFVLQAPVTCLVYVSIESRDFVGQDYPYFRSFELRANDKDRHGVVELERGITAHGTVRDADTRRPIAGATVRPRIQYGVHGEHAAPGPVKRESKSDSDGHYELHGVDANLGVVAYSPDDEQENYAVEVTKGEGTRFDVELPPLEKATLRGNVRDGNGQPLEGVRVQYNGREVQTARDGAYALNCVLGRRGQKKRLPEPWYIKKGFITRQFGSEVGKVAQVVLERQIPLEGQVVGPEGQPVKSFAVCAVPRSADFLNPGSNAIELAVIDAGGRFKLGLDRDGPTWVGIRAPGYQSSEMVTDVPRRGGSVVARLASGVRVEGKIIAPAVALSKIEAQLVPRRHRSDGREFGSGSKAVEWLTRTTNVAADGTLSFDHVRPDRYTLLFKGPGVISRLLALDVPPGGLDLGQIRLAGRGRIQGRVFESRVPRPPGQTYAFGQVAFYPAISSRMMDYVEKIEFMTDFEGQFSIADVPVGLVIVAFPVTVGCVTDIDGPWVRVCENQTTEVHFPGPNGARPVAVEIVIGDGSITQSRSGKGISGKIEKNDTKPPAPKAVPLAGELERELNRELSVERIAPDVERQFRVELIPGPGQPLSSVRSDPAAIDRKGQFVLPDVSPGAYQLRVERGFLQPGTIGFTEVVFERDIAVTADVSTIKVPLGGGSITGRTVKYSAVIAVPRGGPGPLRRTRCDGEGYFCMPFLDPGTYTLFVRSDDDGSWCRVDNVRVASDVKDIGELRQGRGGAIHGSISFPRPCPVPDEVIATGPSQVSLEPMKHISDFDQFELSGLWPGPMDIHRSRGRRDTRDRHDRDQGNRGGYP